MASKLKTKFKVQNRYGAFYTGGKVQFSKNGDFMFCQNGDHIQILDVKNGQLFKTIGQDGEDEVTSFVVSPDDKMLVVAGKSLLLKQYDWMENTVTRTWKAIHISPVSCMRFDVTSTLLATGGSDSTIKVWDVIKQYCTHNLKGHTGVISVAEFHPDIDKLQLFSAGDDYKVRVWDLRSSVCISLLEHHFSVITSVAWTHDHCTLFCGSRDNTVSVWNLENYSKKKTIPVFEGVEGLIVVPKLEDASQIGITSQKHVHFITAGAKGSVKVWNVSSGQCVYTLDLAPPPTTDQQTATDQAITALTYNSTLATISLVTYDHNVLMYNIKDLSLYKQFVGYNDEILDLCLLGDTHLAVASNSELLKVFCLDTWGCHILRGHTDIVMALDVSGNKNYLASASKDNSVRVWYQDPASNTMTCVAVGQGHTNSVQAVAFSRMKNSFIISGSQDLTLKLWPLPPDLHTKGQMNLHAQVTEKAHDKDINAIVVSPNDKLIATGSQDKTAKLWKSEDLTLMGVFRGHKRGVWCVQFSPVDQCIATSSADGSVKIWALSDFSCVKTFEGHGCSVLKVSFLSRGMQLLSTGSDGLLKLWTIKSSECVETFDEHEDKAWALEVTPDESTVVTGGADSTILVWKDVTEEEQEEMMQKQVDFILKEQELQNLLHQKKYLKGLALAISLDQPFRVLTVIKDILAEETGKQKLHKTISKLEDYQIDAVLRYVGTWNTNSKHCFAAQSVLSVMLKTFSPEALLKLPNFKSSLEGLLPYTERHCARLRRLEQQTTFVDYTWQCMRPITDHRQIDSHKALKVKHKVQSGDPMSTSDSSDEEVAEVKLKKHSKHPLVTKESSTSSDSDSSVEMNTDEDKMETDNSPSKSRVNKEASSSESDSDSSDNDMELDKVKKETDKSVTKNQMDKSPTKHQVEKEDNSSDGDSDSSDDGMGTDAKEREMNKSRPKCQVHNSPSKRQPEKSPLKLKVDKSPLKHKTNQLPLKLKVEIDEFSSSGESSSSEDEMDTDAGMKDSIKPLTGKNTSLSTVIENQSSESNHITSPNKVKSESRTPQKADSVQIKAEPKDTKGDIEVNQCISNVSQGQKSDGSSDSDSEAMTLKSTPKSSQKTKDIKKEPELTPSSNESEEDSDFKENVEMSPMVLKRKVSPSKKPHKTPVEMLRKRTRSWSMENEEGSTCKGEDKVKVELNSKKTRSSAMENTLRGEKDNMTLGEVKDEINSPTRSGSLRKTPKRETKDMALKKVKDECNSQKTRTMSPKKTPKGQVKVTDESNYKTSKSGTVEKTPKSETQDMALKKVIEGSNRRRTRSETFEETPKKETSNESLTKVSSNRKTKSSLKKAELKDTTTPIKLRKKLEDIKVEDCEVDDDDDDEEVKTPYTTFRQTGRTPQSAGRVSRKVKLEDIKKELTYTDPGNRRQAQKLKKALRPRKLKSTAK